MHNAFFKRLQACAAVTGLVGVLFGAFGAHFLKERLQDNEMETLKTGVLYLFIHTLATLVICLLAYQQQLPAKWLKSAGMAFMTGILLFSGSVFMISTKNLTGFPASAIGFLTPLGGLSFIAGWIFLLFHSRAN
jgi:uncharacterized membrane protein YgdD (TMEM256/DUF423 family)